MFEAVYIVFNSGVSTFGRYMNVYTYISYLLKHDVVRNRFQEPAMFFVWEHLFLTSTLLKFGYFVLSVLWGSLLRMHAYYFHMFCIRTLSPVRLIVCFITSTHNFRCFSISQMVCILIFLTCDWSCFVCCSVTCPRLANSWAISISGLSCFLVETTVFWLLKGDLRGRFSTFSSEKRQPLPWNWLIFVDGFYYREAHHGQSVYQIIWNSLQLLLSSVLWVYRFPIS